MKRSLLLFLVLGMSSITFAQHSARLPITITGDLSKVSKSNISVSLDGSQVIVSEITRVPSSSSRFVLLMDVSGSNKDKAQFIVSSSLDLFDQLLKAGHSGYFGDFNDELYLDRRTTSLDAAKREVKDSPFRGGSNIYDAIDEAAKFLAKQSKADDALSMIVITDGEDIGSHTNANQAAKDLQERGIVVHEVVLLGHNPDKKKLNELATISTETGGTTIVLNEPKNFAPPLMQAFDQRYSISFTTSIADHLLHQVQYSTTDASLKIHGPARFSLH